MYILILWSNRNNNKRQINDWEAAINTKTSSSRKFVYFNKPIKSCIKCGWEISEYIFLSYYVIKQFIRNIDLLYINKIIRNIIKNSSK